MRPHSRVGAHKCHSFHVCGVCLCFLKTPSGNHAAQRAWSLGGFRMGLFNCSPSSDTTPERNARRPTKALRVFCAQKSRTNQVQSYHQVILCEESDDSFSNGLDIRIRDSQWPPCGQVFKHKAHYNPAPRVERGIEFAEDVSRRHSKKNAPILNKDWLRRCLALVFFTRTLNKTQRGPTGIHHVISESCPTVERISMGGDAHGICPKPDLLRQFTLQGTVRRVTLKWVDGRSLLGQTTVIRLICLGLFAPRFIG